MLSIPRIFHDDDFFHLPLELWSGDDRIGGRNQRSIWPSIFSEMAVPQVHGDKFHVNFPMAQFDPSEISVKFDKNQLMVHGKREKKNEDGGYVYREYKQSMTVPKNVVHDQMKCHLDNKGVLRIEAPVKQEEKKSSERNIPIEFGGGQKQLKG